MQVPPSVRGERPGGQWIGALTDVQLRRLRHALLAWYRPRARPLRIRTTRDAWAILVAEVMAQQTQIARVDEAWSAFMARFPTPRSLAEASQADVLRAWAGLGYNKRALALWRAAGIIEHEHAGRVPDDLGALESLPGVGPYTARAVASVAYGRAVAAVDTNVRRVLSRLIGAPLTASELQDVADHLVAPAEPAQWTHASMELGATVCRSRRPLCSECPLADWCISAGRVATPTGRARTLPSTPFEATTRWLRGRIVARLRDLDGSAWTKLPDVIGEHGPDQVTAMVSALERDGLLERRSDGAVRLPTR